MVKIPFIGFLLGLVFFKLFAPEGTGITYALVLGAVLTAILQACTGDRRSLFLRLCLVVLIGRWFFFFTAYDSRASESYERPTFDQYLQSTWGPAWKKPLAEVKQDRKLLEVHYKHYQQYVRNLEKWEREWKAHLQDLSVFRKSAIATNAAVTSLAQVIGEQIAHATSLTGWVNRPASRWEHALLHSMNALRLPAERARLIGLLGLLALLVSTFALLQSILPREDGHKASVLELFLSTRGLKYAVFLLFLLTLYSLVRYTYFLIGPYSEILMFATPFFVPPILWYSIFRGRELLS